MSNQVRKIYVDSKDRIHSSSNTNDFTVKLGNNLTLQNVESIMMADASIPISFGNITTENNTFYWSERTYAVAEAGVSDDYSNAGANNHSTFTITPGNYTVDTLITAVTAAFNTSITETVAGSGTVNITFDTTTNKFSIQFLGLYYNGEHDIPYYSIGDIFDTVYFDRYFPTIDISKTLNGVMGFVDTLESQRPGVTGGVIEAAYRDAASGTVVYTSTRLHTVYGLEYMYITCNLCTGSITSSANNSLGSILQKIPINSYFSELQFSTSGVHQEPVKTVSSTFSEMSFRIVDADNNLIDLFNGNVSFSILISYKDVVPDFYS
jgi:hypothetical protein